MIIITSGTNYIDIDAYASCIAYAELLTQLGQDALAVSSAILNESITPSLRALPITIDQEHKPTANDDYVIIDRSNPSDFDDIVDQQRVIEVFDHQLIYKSEWSEKLKEKSHIELLGAAATLIYEQWEQSGKLDCMSIAAAQLLAAAILDNTLNFGASMTTKRDRRAFAFLCKHASLDYNWISGYFAECQVTIEMDLPQAIKNDTKFVKFVTFEKELCVGQLVVWDARQFIANELMTIAKTLASMKTEWFINIVSISENCSYFFSHDETIQRWLHHLLGVNFTNDNVASAGRLWLRKEITKVDRETQPVHVSA